MHERFEVWVTFPIFMLIMTLPGMFLFFISDILISFLIGDSSISLIMGTLGFTIGVYFGGAFYFSHVCDIVEGWFR